MISWKLEITENETRLVIQDGIVMSSDVLSIILAHYQFMIKTMRNFSIIN